MHLVAAVLLSTELLRPTGPHAIGRTIHAWRDDARAEVMSKTPAKREVRVDLFYPATKPRNGRPAPYLPDVDAIERYADEHDGKGAFAGAFGAAYPLLRSTVTHTYANAPVAASPKRFPVVVFSHGGGINVLQYTTLIEEIVSHGYVVAAVEHPYDADFVVMPDGRIIEQQGWDDSKRTPAERAAFHRERHRVNAADNSFVLDQLARIDSGAIASPLRHRLDLSRAFAIGHSLGGKVSIVSCAADDRWRGCVNLDGGLDPGERYPRSDKPILAIFGAPAPVKLPIETEEQFAKRKERMGRFLEAASSRELISEYDNLAAPGALAFVSSPGFSHFSYYDLVQPDAEQWGATPERSRVNLAIVRACILAFLDAPADPMSAMRRSGAPLVLVPIGHR